MRFSVNGVALHVTETGTASPTLVFLHYFGGSSRAWSPLIATLAKRHRCVAPDLRGFGCSEGPLTGYDLANTAADVAALVDLLGLGPFVLVGHSMGAKIAMRLAADKPPGLRGLVLIAPSPPTPEPMREADRARLLASHGDPGAACETAKTISNRSPTDPAFLRIVEDSLRSSPVAWAAWLNAGSREDIGAATERIDAPALVIIGEEDVTIPRAVVEREVVARLHAAEAVTIAGARHLVPLDRPEATAAAIERWLASIGHHAATTAVACND